MSDFFDAYNINRRIVKDDFELTLNALPVNLLDFALISNMRERVYGVRIFGGEECSSSCCLNNKARQALWRILFNIQQMIISKKRLLAGPAYIQDTVFIDHSTRSIYTRLSGVETINVVETLEFVTNLVISPFLIHDVELKLEPDGEFVEAHFDSTIALNPHETILRDASSYAQFDWQLQANYPAEDGFNWVMPVGTSMPLSYAANPAVEINLQSYEYMMAEVDPISGVTLSNCVVMHPNTQQILPFAKSPEEVLSQGKLRWRFWFYSWTLGRPEFANDTIDLVEGEFYKLYRVLELYERKEEELTGTIYYQEYLNDCQPEEIEYKSEDTDFHIIDGYSGIVKYDELSNDVLSVPHKRYRARVYYKVNPLVREDLFQDSIEELRRAIVAKTAATINLESCDCVCNVDGEHKDYISQMQQSYTKQSSNPFTGQTTVNYFYGHREGDLLFAEVMKGIKLRNKVVTI